MDSVYQHDPVCQQIVHLGEISFYDGFYKPSWADAVPVPKDAKAKDMNGESHHWGTLRISPMIASRWADNLLPSVRSAMADQRRGVHAFTKSGTPCLSA